MTRHFEIYRNSERQMLALPLGFSWSAASLDWIWTLWLRLWDVSFLLLLLNAICTALLYAPLDLL